VSKPNPPLYQYPEPFGSLLRIPPAEFTFNGKLVIEELVGWDGSREVWDRAIESLKSMNFQMDSESDLRIVMKRGSMFGNYTTFQVTRLCAEARLEAMEGSIRLTVNVNTRGQYFTAWNYVELRCEIADFKTFVETGANKTALRDTLKKQRPRLWKWDWRFAQNYWTA
jgi:hypothetical protein